MAKQKKERSRIRSKITDLPDDVRYKVDAMLMDTKNSYVEISDWLKSQGHDISKSAVGRYWLNLNKVAQRVTETLERTRAIIQAVEKNPDLDYTKASRILMMEGLLQKVSTAEEEFQEMPLDKAGRLINAISRTEVYEQKIKKDYKTKMELAFSELEIKLKDSMKGDTELVSELTEVLDKARDKLYGEGLSN